MMKKKVFFSVLIFALILTLTAVLPLTAGAAEKNIKLRLSSVAAGPGQFPNSDSVKWWMDKVTEKTKGQVTFQSHLGGFSGSARGPYRSSGKRNGGNHFGLPHLYPRKIPPGSL